MTKLYTEELEDYKNGYNVNVIAKVCGIHTQIRMDNKRVDSISIMGREGIIIHKIGNIRFGGFGKEIDSKLLEEAKQLENDLIHKNYIFVERYKDL